MRITFTFVTSLFKILHCVFKIKLRYSKVNAMKSRTYDCEMSNLFIARYKCDNLYFTEDYSLKQMTSRPEDKVTLYASLV